MQLPSGRAEEQCVTRGGLVSRRTNILERESPSMAAPATTSSPAISHCAFDVRGRVQGVFFRKYTKQAADALGVVGWVQNDAADTDRVVGVAEGSAAAVSAFVAWLREKGSPKSKVVSVALSEQRTLPWPSFAAFDIRR